MTEISVSTTRTTRQWPVFAGVGLLYVLLLESVFFRVGGPAELTLGQRVAVGLFLVLFNLAEVAMLVLFNELLEWLSRGVRSKKSLDVLKALILTLTLTTFCASLIKFLAARAHLRFTDLWFVFTNFHQLSEEVLGSELSTAALLGGGFVLLFAGLFVALRRFRRGGPEVSVPSFAVLAAVALIGTWISWTRYDTVPVVARFVVPEIHWLARGAVVGLTGGSAEKPSGLQPPIVSYDPPAVGSDGVRADNVVLIMLESTPWSRLGLTGAPPGITPNLDRLAEESVVFTHAYSTSVHSDYAQMAILSSLFPRKYNHHDYYQELDYPRTLLWDILRPAGWRTSMFSCQNEAWGNMISYLRTPGLETMVHSPDFPPETPRKGRGDESKVYEEAVVEAWRRWRDKQARMPDVKPYFTYLNFQADHFPYVIPDDAPHPLSPHELNFLVSFLGFPHNRIPVMENRFYNALAYADHWIGEVRRTLEETGEWERTVFIVVSDHGEAFYEHEQPTHGTALYEEQVRSVWVMRLPGEAPRWIEEPVSLLDLAPTLIRYLGLPPHGNFQGRDDLLEPGYSGRDRPLFFTIQGMTFEDGLLLDGWKYMINWDQQVHHLYHLDVDPGEHTDLVETDSATAERLQGLLLDFLGSQIGYYAESGWKAGRYPPRLP